MVEYPIPDMADVELIDVLKALADPIRLKLVQTLADGDPHPKGAEDWGFPVEKSTLAHHFRTLREAGLVTYGIHGRTHTISLRKAELEARFPGLVESLRTPTR